MEDDGRITKPLALKLSDPTYVLQSLREGQGGQLIFGYSDELMLTLYKKAHHYLEENKIGKAIDSFTFLVTLSPFHYEYWMGLGAALQLDHDYNSAIDAYEMAAIYNMENPLPYLYLGKCLFAIHDRKSALQAFDLAITYADDIGEFSQIKEEAVTAKEHLSHMEE